MRASGNRKVVFLIFCVLLPVCSFHASSQTEARLLIDPENFIIGADVSSMQQFMMGGGRFGAKTAMRNIGVQTAPPVSSLAPIAGADVRGIAGSEADGGSKINPFAILAGKGVNFACIGATFAEGSVDNALSLARRAKDSGLKIMIVKQYRLPIAIVVDDTGALDSVRSLLNGLPKGIGLGTFVSDSITGGLLETGEVALQDFQE